MERTPFSEQFAHFAKRVSARTWSSLKKVWHYWVIDWPYIKDLTVFVWKLIFISVSLATLTIFKTIALPLTATIISATAIIVAALVTTIIGQAVLAASTAWAAVNFLGFSIDDINSTEGFWAILESLLG